MILEWTTEKYKKKDSLAFILRKFPIVISEYQNSLRKQVHLPNFLKHRMDPLKIRKNANLIYKFYKEAKLKLVSLKSPITTEHEEIGSLL